MALQRPRLWWKLCFNAEPNDPSAVPVWQDYTSNVKMIGMNRRGRLYELAQSVAADPKITWRDPDEDLNPVNTSSPEYPNVLPYRRVLGQAMWPNNDVSLGSAVNLLNSNRWRPNNQVATDPSFESYANGASMPNWLTAVGSTVPTVTTTNPQQGTKSLTYTVAGTTTRQGVSWEIPCVPDEQYNTSVYVRQSSASTQQLSVIDQTLGYDEFNRTSASTWTTSTSGLTYTISGGANGDYTVAPGVGSISVSATNSSRYSKASVGNIDMTLQCLLTSVSTPAGSFSRQGLVARYTDASNNYQGVIDISTSGYISAVIRKVVAGVSTTLATTVTSLRTGEGVMCKFSAQGPLLKLKVWNESEFEPSAWTAEVTDTSLTSGSSGGAVCLRDTGQTSPTVFTYAHLYVVGSVSSTTTTTTGAYVRLDATFTATQPLHTVQLVTIGTAVAGTVNIDALQHEPGASASAFSTSGPVIFPILNNFAERFPREFEAAGFVGKTVTPAVDAFAALNSISINSDYASAVQATKPAYWWPLSGGPGTQQALEVSGNGGPSLTQFDSKYGAGPAPAFGTQIAIAGDAGSTGVRFEPVSLGVSFAAGSILSLGRVATSPGILFPREYGTTVWSASISCWAQVNITASDSSMVLVGPFGVSAPNPTSPIAITATSFASPFSVVDYRVTVQGAPTGAVATASALDRDDGVHLIVGTVTQTSGGNTVVKMYFDGTLIQTTTVTTASLGGIFSAEATYLNVGGNSNGGLIVDGVVAHAILWERELTASEVAALWTAGGLGNDGELSGTRLERHLTAGAFAGKRRISAGSTLMQPPTFVGSIDLLSDAQQITLAEGGTFWVAPDGATVMEGRQDRWLRLTSVATFGEDVANGEIPYLDGVIFDNDPTFVYADVRITRNNGAVAVGGTRAQIVAATRKFFGRSYAIGGDFQTDTIAQDYANYVFNTHYSPLLRVSAITIDPSAYPTIWTKALNLEIGQRVTVKRRATAANGGTGLTMSAECFIESVIHHEMDMDKQVWRISFLLSPIGVVPGPSMQPWILENATYGVLNSTTILGW